MVDKIVTYFRKRSKLQKTIKELESLSDRELNDIGISRSDIRRVITQK